MNDKDVTDWFYTKWKDMLENYSKDNISNDDETNIFCNLIPYQTISTEVKDLCAIS